MNGAVKGYSCRMSLLGVVLDELGSGGVLLLDEFVTGVRDALGSEGVVLLDECVTGVRHALDSEGVLLPDEFVRCSAGRTGL